MSEEDQRGTVGVHLIQRTSCFFSLNTAGRCLFVAESPRIPGYPGNPVDSATTTRISERSPRCDNS